MKLVSLATLPIQRELVRNSEQRKDSAEKAEGAAEATLLPLGENGSRGTRKRGRKSKPGPRPPPPLLKVRGTFMSPNN